MAIAAADIMKLRTATSAGMMDCKKALEEAAGDFQKAVEIIRKKGLAIATKRADKEASEGAVLAGTNGDNSFAAVVAVNCETDFVAKNDNFIGLVQNILDKTISAQPKDLEAAKLVDVGGNSAAEEVVAQMGVIGEKMEIPFYGCVEAPYTISYIHPGNKLATIVGFNKVCDEQVAKDVAMQVAAMSPAGVDKDDVPQDVIDKELEIGKEKARQEGKPEAILDKIAQGRLNKFFKESTLLNQAFVKDNKQTIAEYLKQNDKDLTVTKFVRYSLK